MSVSPALRLGRAPHIGSLALLRYGKREVTRETNLSITGGMSPDFQRPKWEIDKRLESLLGENIRVRASAFCPPHWDGGGGPVIEGSGLTLPDDTAVDKDALYLEGKLLSFQREVGVVFVSLDRPDTPDTANGRVVHRGRSSVILPGPATVRLHQEHFIERISTDARLYWSQLRDTGPQFSLPFDE